MNQRITYSWTPEEEPLDLDRMVDSVQQINLKHYYDFISKSTKKDKDLVSNKLLLIYIGKIYNLNYISEISRCRSEYIQVRSEDFCASDKNVKQNQ